MSDMNEIIDLQRYPLDRLESVEGERLVRQCKEDLEGNGMFTLEGFLRAETIAGILPELLGKLETESFFHSREHNIYFEDDPVGVPTGHPALVQVKTINHTLCGDQIEGPLLALYRWPQLALFLARVMQKPRLHPMEDPLACANVIGYYAGEGLNWHFDRSEFTTTLLLQAPEQGGDFQYRYNLRSESDPNYDGIARLLQGDDDAVSTLSLGAGDLNVFKGVCTAHRITPPVGDRARVITIFTYYEAPGRRFSDAENQGFYGRTNS